VKPGFVVWLIRFKLVLRSWDRSTSALL